MPELHYAGWEIMAMSQREGIPSGLPVGSPSAPDGKLVWACERDSQRGREAEGGDADIPSACPKTSD